MQSSSSPSTSTSTSPWGKVAAAPVETINFSDIMSEEYARKLHKDEIQRYEQKLAKRQEQPRKDSISYAESVAATKDDDNEEWEDFSEILDKVDDSIIPPEVLKVLQDDPVQKEIDSDAVIAQMLQSQFDYEYNEELRRIEQKRNKHAKVTVTLDKYRRDGDFEFLNDTKDSLEDQDDDDTNRDWDRFETNDKKLDAIPKCGFKVNEDGEMVTKHDPHMCGVRNACKVMSFPPEFSTGDGAGFEMKLDNKVFNQLKTYSRRIKKNNVQDRKEGFATAEMGVDVATRLLLYKLINNQILEQINGIISTGKEAVILHANSDQNYSGDCSDPKSNSGYNALMPAHLLPKECAVKIFKTTLNEFKQRDRYIKDDYRFKDRMSKQKHNLVINMWAEKEMHNMMRMQNVGINCPDVIILKKHVLVMSFIGDNHNAAPKLKDARLTDSELAIAYEEIIAAMHKLYNEAKLVHADLSEYNILWYDNKCWFIDVAQSVEPEHPSALEFLMRDCGNIINFFTKRGLPKIYTKEELFNYITDFDAESHNVGMLERIHTRGATRKQATAPNLDECPDELKPLSYPFDLAWEKSQAERKQQQQSQPSTSSNEAAAIIIDDAARAMEVLSVTTPFEKVEKQKSHKNSSSSSTKSKVAKKQNTGKN